MGTLMILATGSSASSCDPEPEEEEHSKICVDEQTGNRVEDDQCNDGHRGAHWYYGSSVHPAPAVGQPVNKTHFSTTKPTFGKVSTVSRAGFGGRTSGGGS